MFGFIRPVKSELRVKEVDRFQSVYCGLCHAIKESYGRFYTFFLSYDMTFLALVLGSDESETAPVLQKRCDAHPVCKRACAAADDAIHTAADMSVLFCYHKMRDSVMDEKGAKKLFAKLLLGLGKKGYQKARERFPEADAEMVCALADLTALEKENCNSMDRAADASARLTAAAIPKTGDAKERILKQMFYHVGRWIYLLDACADLEEDLNDGNYNPVARRFDLEKPDLTEIKEPMTRTLERSLVDVCTAFDLLDIRRDSELIHNIIFLGMPVVTTQVLSGKYQMNGGWGKHGSL